MRQLHWIENSGATCCQRSQAICGWVTESDSIFFAKSISCQWILRLVSQWRHLGVIAIESIDDFPEPGYNPPTRLVLHRRHKITSRLLLMPSFPFCCPVISCFSRVRPKRLAAISVVIPCAIVQRRRGFMRKTHGCESQRQ